MWPCGVLSRMSTVMLTSKEINQVKLVASYGLTQEQIADCLDISDRTLRERFLTDERAASAYKGGRSKGIREVSKTVFRKAIEGNVACAFFYLKTRSGAEWIYKRWREGKARRIGLIAPTPADARDVMIEGESGILNVGFPDERPTYFPSKRRLVWPDGAQATIFSGYEPDQEIGR